MIRFEFTEVVDRPAEEVFAYLTDCGKVARVAIDGL
jgi:hypothetical protein